MPFDPPRSLSPSKISTFRQCALAFRFNSIERLPELPTIWTVKGTLVHRALERLLWLHEPGDRSPRTAEVELNSAWEELQSDPDFLALDLPEQDAADLREEAATLVQNYFALEDPNEVNPVGVELTLDARVGALRLRGIIDRLDRTADGELVVVDYKTGRHLLTADDARSSIALALYALAAGRALRRPCHRVELHHLPSGQVLAWSHSESSLARHLGRAEDIAEECAAADELMREGLPAQRYDEIFPPRPSAACGWCDYLRHCPEGTAAAVVRQPWDGLSPD